MTGALILKPAPSASAAPVVLPDAADESIEARRARWSAAWARHEERRTARDDERARCAWLLAIDVAEKAVEGAGFARIYSTPGKVGRGSDNRTALARKLACYLTGTVGNCDVASIARAARLNRKTVHAHLREVEDLRDDGWIDTRLDEMGRAMVAAAASLVLANLGAAA